MGEYAEDRLEYEMARAGVPGSRRLNSYQKNQYWTMKDGTRIRFEDMEPAHRMNCINLMISRLGEEAAEASYAVRRMRELGAGYYFE